MDTKIDEALAKELHDEADGGGAWRPTRTVDTHLLRRAAISIEILVGELKRTSPTESG